MGVPLQGMHRGGGDVLVVPQMGVGRSDFDLVGDGPHAMHAFGHLFSRVLLRIDRYMAGERYHTVLGGHADLRGIDTRLPLEFIQDVTLQMCVGFHDNSPSAIDAEH